MEKITSKPKWNVDFSKMRKITEEYKELVKKQKKKERNKALKDWLNGDTDVNPFNYETQEG